MFFCGMGRVDDTTVSLINMIHSYNRPRRFAMDPEYGRGKLGSNNSILMSFIEQYSIISPQTLYLV